MQIAIECNLRYNEVSDIIKKEKIVPVAIIKARNYYDKYQEEIIHRVLYFTGLLTELTIESKINHVESKEELFQQFREFKLKTYTR